MKKINWTITVLLFGSVLFNQQHSETLLDFFSKSYVIQDGKINIEIHSRPINYLNDLGDFIPIPDVENIDSLNTLVESQITSYYNQSRYNYEPSYGHYSINQYYNATGGTIYEWGGGSIEFITSNRVNPLESPGNHRFYEKWRITIGDLIGPNPVVTNVIYMNDISAYDGLGNCAVGETSYTINVKKFTPSGTPTIAQYWNYIDSGLPYYSHTVIKNGASPATITIPGVYKPGLINSINDAINSEDSYYSMYFGFSIQDEDYVCDEYIYDNFVTNFENHFMIIQVSNPISVTMVNEASSDQFQLGGRLGIDSDPSNGGWEYDPDNGTGLNSGSVVPNLEWNYQYDVLTQSPRLTRSDTWEMLKHLRWNNESTEFYRIANDLHISDSFEYAAQFASFIPDGINISIDEGISVEFSDPWYIENGVQNTEYLQITNNQSLPYIFDNRGNLQGLESLEYPFYSFHILSPFLATTDGIYEVGFEVVDASGAPAGDVVPDPRYSDNTHFAVVFDIDAATLRFILTAVNLQENAQIHIVSTDYLSIPAGADITFAQNVDIIVDGTLNIVASSGNATSLNFAPDCEVLVNGDLQIQGVENDNVILSSSSTWDGIKISPTGNVDIQHATIQNSEKGLWFIPKTDNVVVGQSTITNTIFNDNIINSIYFDNQICNQTNGQGTYIITRHLNIDKCSFVNSITETTGNAINIEDSNQRITITESAFENSNIFASSYYGSFVLRENTFTNIASTIIKRVELDGRGLYNLEYNTFEGNDDGSNYPLLRIHIPPHEIPYNEPNYNLWGEPAYYINVSKNTFIDGYISIISSVIAGSYFYTEFSHNIVYARNPELSSGLEIYQDSFLDHNVFSGYTYPTYPPVDQYNFNLDNFVADPLFYSTDLNNPLGYHVKWGIEECCYGIQELCNAGVELPKFGSPCVNYNDLYTIGRNQYNKAKGDINGDQLVNVLETTSIVYYIMNFPFPLLENSVTDWVADNPLPGLVPEFEWGSWSFGPHVVLESPNWAAEVTGDGSINVGDVVSIISCITNGGTYCNFNARSDLQVGSVSYNLLYSNNNQTFRSGFDDLELSINSDVEVAGVQLEVLFDNSIAEFIGIEQTDVSSELNLEYRLTEEGKVRLILYPETDYFIPSGNNHILTLRFEGLTRNSNGQPDILISDPIFAGFGGIRLDIITIENIPIEFSLKPAYPNPFNPITTIQYDIPVTGNVSIILYDMLGREVKVLVDNEANIGSHFISFSGANMASGTYFVKMKSGEFTQTQKIMLVK